jgi:hypothetical protein
MDQSAFDVTLPTQVEALLSRPVNFAESVKQRSTVKFRCQNGSAFNNNSRTMQFRLSSEDYLDMSTAQLLFTLKTTEAGQVPEDLFGLACIQNARLEVAGKVVEDIRGYNRCIKPLVYHGVSKEYMNSVLTTAGAYKHKPMYTGILQAQYADNAGAGDQGGNVFRPNSTGGTFRYTLDGASTLGTVSPYQATQPVTAYNVQLQAPTDHNASGGLVSARDAEGLDASTVYPIPYGETTQNNSSADPARYVGHNCSSNFTVAGGVLPNSMPCWGGRDTSSAPGYQYSGIGSAKGERDYAVPLSLIFGMARAKSYIPLRNMGSILITLDLCPYEEMFIHVAPKQAIKDCVASWHAADAISDALTEACSYTVQAPVISCDVVQVADSAVARVDALCSGAEGYSLPIETYSCITQPFTYSSDITLNFTRSFSMLRDTYVSFQEEKTSKNLFLNKSDTFLGSRYISSNTQVGSTNYPVSDITGPAEAYSELRKSNNMTNHTTGSCVDYCAYTGKRDAIKSDRYEHAGLMPSIALATNAGKKKAALLQATSLWSQKPSHFLLGQSLERVLAGGMTFTGVSTRVAGYAITMNIKFKDWSMLNPLGTSDPAKESLANPQFIDAHLGGNNLKMLANAAMHHDVLIRVQNDAVEVST